MSRRLRCIGSVAVIATLTSLLSFSAANATSSDFVDTPSIIKDTLGVNWDGWQLSVENKTGKELQLIKTLGISDASTPVIASGGITTGIRGRQASGWSCYRNPDKCEHYPEDIVLVYSDNLPAGTLYFIAIDGASKLHLQFRCGILLNAPHLKTNPLKDSTWRPEECTLPGMEKGLNRSALANPIKAIFTATDIPAS